MCQFIYQLNSLNHTKLAMHLIKGFVLRKSYVKYSRKEQRSLFWWYFINRRQPAKPFWIKLPMYDLSWHHIDRTWGRKNCDVNHHFTNLNYRSMDYGVIVSLLETCQSYVLHCILYTRMALFRCNKEKKRRKLLLTGLTLILITFDSNDSLSQQTCRWTHIHNWVSL